SIRRTRSDTEPPDSTPVVRKIFPPAITGDDHPLPGSSFRHVTFFVGPHSVGGLPSAWPCPVGPRNCGQSAARSSSESGRERANPSRTRCIGGGSGGGSGRAGGTASRGPSGPGFGGGGGFSRGGRGRPGRTG